MESDLKRFPIYLLFVNCLSLKLTFDVLFSNEIPDERVVKYYTIHYLYCVYVVRTYNMLEYGHTGFIFCQILCQTCDISNIYIFCIFTMIFFLLERHCSTYNSHIVQWAFFITLGWFIVHDHYYQESGVKCYK